jgi:flagellar protein FlaJ
MEKEKKTEHGRDYGIYLEKTNIRFTVIQWFAIAIICAIGSGLVLFLIIPKTLNFVIMFPLLILVVFLGAPIILKERRDMKIEDSVSDVFEELATSLRAGATIEQALLDLTKIQKGPLIDELKIALNDMEGGLSFEEALQNLISRIDVILLKRIFTIVVDGRKAGGELADILDSVASDAREIARLQRERISKTMMYTIFIFAAGGVVAPIIFAFVTQIGDVVMTMDPSASNPLVFMGISVLWLYLLIQSFISGIMMAIVRGDRMWKGLLMYSVTMAVISTVIFEVMKIIAAGMLVAQ